MASFRTDRGLDRLVNFSDAAVVIAITLLVLPLVGVATEITRHHATVWGIFLANGGTFLAFAISFVVIARFWVVHHRVFEFVRDYNPTIVWLNFLWLASIVFLPFSRPYSSSSLSSSPCSSRRSACSGCSSCCWAAPSTPSWTGSARGGYRKSRRESRV